MERSEGAAFQERMRARGRSDNASEGGRSLNRRVEIELYRFAPRYASLKLASERDD